MKKPIFSDIGIEYSDQRVGEILGLPVASKEPVPDAVDGEIVIYYGGWDLQTLRLCGAGQTHMRQDQHWYDDREWTAEPGYYRILLPVPGSNMKPWSEQIAQLRTIDEAWQPAPVCVAATALLVHLTETGNDLLQNEWCRCAEPLPDEDRVGLTVDGGRVCVGCLWGGDRDHYLWLSSACRKC